MRSRSNSRNKTTLNWRTMKMCPSVRQHVAELEELLGEEMEVRKTAIQGRPAIEVTAGNWFYFCDEVGLNENRAT